MNDLAWRTKVVEGELNNAITDLQKLLLNSFMTDTTTEIDFKEIFMSVMKIQLHTNYLMVESQLKANTNNIHDVLPDDTCALINAVTKEISLNINSEFIKDINDMDLHDLISTMHYLINETFKNELSSSQKKVVIQQYIVLVGFIVNAVNLNAYLLLRSKDMDHADLVVPTVTELGRIRYLDTLSKYNDVLIINIHNMCNPDNVIDLPDIYE